MAKISGVALGNDRYIYDLTEHLIIVSEKLSHPSFELVSTNGIADLAAYS